jgi:UDP-perosamine 4-acetyltransferase
MTSTPAKPNCAILGGGGHARVLIDCLRLGGVVEPALILDACASLWGTTVDDVPVRGGDELLSRLRAEGVEFFSVGLGHGPRPKLFAAALAAGLLPVTAIHPRATISSRAGIDRGGQIFAAAVVNAGARLGENVIINTGAIIEHDCVISSHVHIACGACLAGGVVVEEGAFVGAGSTIKPGLCIGAGAVVGAGAMVTKPVAPGSTVIGVPARARP